MILLEPVVQIDTGPMPHILPQFGPDRSRVAIVAVRGNPIRDHPDGCLGGAEKCLGGAGQGSACVAGGIPAEGAAIARCSLNITSTNAPERPMARYRWHDWRQLRARAGATHGRVGAAGVAALRPGTVAEFHSGIASAIREHRRSQPYPDQRREREYIVKLTKFGGDLVDLRIALSAYGPGILPWVQEACPGHPPGSVEVADERMMVGYSAASPHVTPCRTWITGRGCRSCDVRKRSSGMQATGGSSPRVGGTASANRTEVRGRGNAGPQLDLAMAGPARRRDTAGPSVSAVLLQSRLQVRQTNIGWKWK
jgi:hypothetical protein